MSYAQRLVDFVTQSLLPAWKEAGMDPGGGFYERLGPKLSPVEMGYRRLLTQTRLVFSFSEGFLLGSPSWARQVATDGFRFACEHYWNASRGGWYFSLGDGGQMPGRTRHLYAHAFVLLACGSYFRATDDPQALQWADRTMEFLDRHFRMSGGGFATALNEELVDLEEPLQQNPHMHLFEACIDLYDATSQSKYAALGAEIVDLLLDRFVDPATGTLTEFFDHAWYPHPDYGHIVEPGHHFEWAWLICRWLQIAPNSLCGPRSDDLRKLAGGLTSWAVGRGIDSQYGGIFDELDRTGSVLKDTKRIWPVTEALKALRFVQASEVARSDTQFHFERLFDLLFDRYLRPASGTWTERLDRQLQPLTDFHPPTTIYHLTMAARELARENGS
jgi:mannose-6-phosphate isomerase